MTKVLNGPEKSQSEALDISETASNRLVVGLSWDPAKENKREDFIRQSLSGMKDLLTGDVMLVRSNLERFMERNDDPKKRDGGPTFDLDLSCYAFNKDGEFLSVVSPDIWEAISPDGTVYHSDDNMTGHGEECDDEQIHIETKNLDKDINLFFVVVSDCDFSLDEIKNPEIRIADSKTNDNKLRVAIAPPANLDASAYVFCRVFYNGENWCVENVSEYGDFYTDWPEYLKKFI